jgi:hypothetical protein
MSLNVHMGKLTCELQHGILGSAECLEEQDNSTLSAELIRSITSCGNTLLDVVCTPTLLTLRSTRPMHMLALLDHP